VERSPVGGAGAERGWTRRWRELRFVLWHGQGAAGQLFTQPLKLHDGPGACFCKLPRAALTTCSSKPSRAVVAGGTSSPCGPLTCKVEGVALMQDSLGAHDVLDLAILRVDLKQEEPVHAAKPGLSNGEPIQVFTDHLHGGGVLALHGQVEVLEPLEWSAWAGKRWCVCMWGGGGGSRRS
jgi:hypothetical protein